MTEGAKNRILDTLRTIGKLRKHFEDQMYKYLSGDSEEFEKLLGSYQEAVILVGTSIENTLAEEFRGNCISLLEEYCEDIFVFSQSLENADSYRKALIVLREKHRLVEEKVRDLPTRKMALFLPYKFSMWDCLESIYIAADKDPEWDAVLMPIPYREREEGKDDNWLYEGPSLYGGLNAKVYNEFDIGEQKPDVIYIHNPYDGMNIVTSVASDFYSDVLKQHCKKLVYVPYFFTNVQFPGVHRNIPTYENFDYIIVPSEVAKEQLAEFNPVDKVLDLGSPKIDRMLLLEKNYTLPEEWSNRIRGRKAVLYNVSINSILQNGFQTILKMIYVFNYFKCNQDVVLWWRPHPLLKSTLKTMRPELYGAYEAMEKKFILEKIGIYDDTPDSNRAVAATDGFLGDYSSLCGLYGIVGKPIFLTDTISMEEPTDADCRRFKIVCPICDAVGRIEKDGNLVVYSNEYMSLCMMDLRDYSIQILKRFDKPFCKMQAYYVDDATKTEIYLFPMDCDDETLIYRVCDGSISSTDIFKGVSVARYGNVMNRGDYWMLSAREETETLFIHKETGEQTKSENINSQLNELSEITGDPLLTGVSVVIDNELYVLAYQVGKMYILNLASKKARLVSIGDGQTRYSSFAYIKDEIWLLSWDGKEIARWNFRDNSLVKITNMPNGYAGMSSTLWARYTPASLGFIYLNGRLLVLPYLANMILEVDMEANEVKPYLVKLPYEEGQRKASYYCDRSNYISIMLYDNEVILQTAFDNSIVRINLENDVVSVADCLIPENVYEEFKVPVINQATRDNTRSPLYIREKGIHCSLGDMMHFMQNVDALWDKKKQHDFSCEGVNNADGTCGERIHEYIKTKC